MRRFAVPLTLCVVSACGADQGDYAAGSAGSPWPVDLTAAAEAKGTCHPFADGWTYTLRLQDEAERTDGSERFAMIMKMPPSNKVLISFLRRSGGFAMGSVNFSSRTVYWHSGDEGDRPQASTVQEAQAEWNSEHGRLLVALATRAVAECAGSDSISASAPPS